MTFIKKNLTIEVKSLAGQVLNRQEFKPRGK
jgi:hypothetical protein